MGRRPRRAVALAVLVGVLAACTSGGDEADPTPAPTGDDPTVTTLAPTTSTTVVGEPIVVAEQGFSTYPDPIDPTASLGGYGVVLRNPDPKLMATGVRVVTRILDAAGGELLADSATLNGILPGEEMAVGRTLLEPIDEPARLDVRVEVAAWIPPAHDGGFVVRDVVTEAVEDGGATTRFTVTSAWPTTEDVIDVTAVYRAADGRILSAESTTVETLAPKASSPETIELLSPIPEVTRTDVYVSRGIQAQTVG